MRLWPDDEPKRTDFLARRRRATGETLARMYESVGLPEEVMKAEMETERSLLVANPSVKEIIGQKRSEGYVVKFLSDMYLPSTVLTDALMAAGCMMEGDEVIVSCEVGARKDSGSLYDFVRRKYNPKEWIHYGDNRRSDVKMARKKGVKPIWVDTSYSETEHRIADLSGQYRNGWQLKMLAGVARAARITAGNTPEATIAADHVGPAYIPYVEYDLNEASRQGIKRLHFLSRDGFILKEIAQCLISVNGYDGIDLNYLFVSRRSLTRAYLYGKTKNAFLEIVDRKTLLRKTVDSLLAKLSLERKELADNYGVTFDYDKIKTEAQQQDFLRKIFETPGFTPRFTEMCRESRELVESYLRQEGFSDTEHRQAFVDIGWLGTSRLMLNSILRDMGLPICVTFYVGVRNDVISEERAGRYQVYYPAGDLDTCATALIESYFSASPWPTTLAYKKCEGKVEPVFPEGQNMEWNNVDRTNCDVSRLMASWLAVLPRIDAEIGYRWAHESLYSLAHCKSVTNLMPLALLKGVGEEPLVKRFSLPETFKNVVTGKVVSGFDCGSLHYTFGPRWGRRLWIVHSNAGKLRQRLYRRFVNK